MWFNRVWRCAEPACGQRTWSERHPAIRPRAVLTERAPGRVRVARVAADLGVGWATVMRAFWEHGQRILDQQWLHTNVTGLGLDETGFLAATATSSTQFVTGLVDPSRRTGGGAAAARSIAATKRAVHVPPGHTALGGDVRQRPGGAPASARTMIK